MSSPKVSVRMALYNHEAYVREALESVRRDSYANKELVIIDDGSTDNSADAVRRWIDEAKPDFPVIFKSRENRGVTRTLNELVSLCTGDYLVSLASDDMLVDGGIEKRLDYLRRHPEKQAVFGDCLVIGENGGILHESGLSGFYKANLERYRDDDGLLDEIVTNWSVPGSILMVRRGIYGLVGGYNESLQIEDWDFYMRMAAKKLLGFTEDIVACYRLHGSNTSSNPLGKRLRYKQQALTALYNLPGAAAGHKLYLLRKALLCGWRSISPSARAGSS